jgi:hypothetical protein
MEVAQQMMEERRLREQEASLRLEQVGHSLQLEHEVK